LTWRGSPEEGFEDLPESGLQRGDAPLQRLHQRQHGHLRDGRNLVPELLWNRRCGDHTAVVTAPSKSRQPLRPVNAYPVAIETE